jgi:hypothetical protein
MLLLAACFWAVSGTADLPPLPDDVPLVISIDGKANIVGGTLRSCRVRCDFLLTGCESFTVARALSTRII